MAGGIPSPEYFPFETLSATVLAVDTLPLDPPRKPSNKKSLLQWLFGPKTTSFTVPKYVPGGDASTIQLATSLQYQQATGPPALPAFLREYVSKVYRPGYADWDVLINCGCDRCLGQDLLHVDGKGRCDSCRGMDVPWCRKRISSDGGGNGPNQDGRTGSLARAP